MNFLTSILFSCLLTLATLLSLKVVDNSAAQAQMGKPETLQLVAGLSGRDIILPPTIPHAFTGYKIWVYIFEQHKLTISDPAWKVVCSGVYPARDYIKKYSRLIIYPFHSFW